MKIRFVVPNDDGDEPLFDKTWDLPSAPLPGETVGVDDYFNTGHPGQLLLEVEHRRWYVGGDEPTLECWLSGSQGTMRHNLYVHSGCRYGLEKLMASSMPRTTDNDRA